MNNYIFNPKTIGSGIITCIPQVGLCPNNCEDCFFQSGRSYLEPLNDNLPQIPSKEITEGRIVRFNDGNDSNNQRELVMETAKQYKNYFFNTAIPYKLEEFFAPVVLTVNPGKLTDTDFHSLTVSIPKNLMFIRARVNSWNVGLIGQIVDYYTSLKTIVVLTFMAYYTNNIPEQHREYYTWKKRTINTYWCLKQERVEEIFDLFRNNPYVYLCGYKGTYTCQRCGNCIREYFNTIERMRG